MASSLNYSSVTDTSTWPTLPSFLSAKGLTSRPTSPLGVFSPAKNHAILVVGVACASFSLLAALISLRWFLLMRRSYRHHLILFLIFSDTFKSLWYFVFPIVVFTRGQVQSSSKFCQASGFFLSVGLEASDFAILVIALHTALYVFRRPRIKGEGGLYPYRKYFYPLWLGLPILSAGLAFTNSQQAYVTSGTFCYLPKRPFWYRLALAWIPRYLIFVTIFSIYAAIWAYVNHKFKGFQEVGNSEYSSGSNSHSMSEQGQSRANSKNFDFGPASKAKREDRRKESTISNGDPLQPERPPWEDVSFITSKPLQDAGVSSADFAPDAGSSSTDARAASRHMSIQSMGQDPSSSRKQSEVPFLATNPTNENTTRESSTVTPPNSSLTNRGTTNHLNSARSAVRRQLRLLFIYPLVYLLMWTFPFASHCLLYSDYYAAHPPFWLSVITTASLSLQAGIDCLVFSWRERPWNRIESSQDGSWSSIVLGQFRKESTGEQASPSRKAEEPPPPSPKRDSNWWEAEGRRRQDSVWMGTDQMNRIVTRQEREEERDGERERQERGDEEQEREREDEQGNELRS